MDKPRMTQRDRDRVCGKKYVLLIKKAFLIKKVLLAIICLHVYHLLSPYIIIPIGYG